MISEISGIYNSYGGVDKIFIDGANPEFIRSLKSVFGERLEYQLQLDKIKQKKQNLYSWMNIIPVSFRQEHRETLAHVKTLLDSEILACHLKRIPS
jgi:hypothetical protein